MGRTAQTLFYCVVLAIDFYVANFAEMVYVDRMWYEEQLLKKFEK